MLQVVVQTWVMLKMMGDDDHDQRGLKEVDCYSTETEENEVMLLNTTTKGEADSVWFKGGR